MADLCFEKTSVKCMMQPHVTYFKTMELFLLWSYFSTVFQNAENIPVVNMVLVFPDVVNAIGKNVFVFFVKQINSCPHTNEKVLCIYADVHILLLD